MQNSTQPIGAFVGFAERNEQRALVGVACGRHRQRGERDHARGRTAPEKRFGARMFAPELM